MAPLPGRPHSALPRRTRRHVTRAGRLTVAWLLMLAHGWPTPAAAQDMAIDAFVQDYARAWSARSPVPLVALAADPASFGPLVGLGRWDHLAEASATVDVLGVDAGVRGRLVLTLRRTQRDRFDQGTFAHASAVEQVTVAPGEGGLRIVRHAVTGPARVRTAAPDTWPAERALERALFGALEALAAQDRRRCMANLAPLFGDDPAGKPPHVDLPEPFPGRRLAAANALYVRAACRLLPGDRGDEATDARRAAAASRDDLDGALLREPDHALARLLRGTLGLQDLHRLPHGSLDEGLDTVRADLRVAAATAPQLREATNTLRLVEAAIALRAGPDDQHDATRRRIAMELLRAHEMLPSALLRRLGGERALFAAGPAALAVAAEVALSADNLQEASRLLGLLAVRCDQCPESLYLRGREAERVHDQAAALAYYERLLDRAPDHRDAIWRLASIGLQEGRPERARVLQLLRTLASRADAEGRRALRLLVVLAERRERGDDGLLRLVMSRFGEGPIPGAVRHALAGDLRRR